MSSSIDASASTVRHQLTGAESSNEVAPVGKYSLSSGPESASWQLGPVSTVTRTPLGTKVDGQHTVMYDSSRADLIVVRVDVTSPGAAEGGSEATLSSPSMCEHSRKRKKDKKKKKKKQKGHSSIPSSPTGKLARRADR